MKLGIMQPYFFPYIGYFQLIKAVDRFVVYDDVQWIKGGWINRNRILVQGKPHYITLPIQEGSTFLKINERTLSSDIEQQKEKILRQIQQTYRKAPYFDSVMQLVSNCLERRESNVSAFIVNSLRTCCDYLGIQTPFILSSCLDSKKQLKGQYRVIDINVSIGANHYINPIGGIELYDKATFAANGLRLSFIKARNITYEQFGIHPFVPSLSIIDVMMFNAQPQIDNLLNQYDLLQPASDGFPSENCAERSRTHLGDGALSFEEGGEWALQH